MRVLHISTCDTGGVARVTMRWHACLKVAGVDSRVLCFRKSSDDPNIFEPYLLSDRTASIKSRATQERWIDGCRTSFSDSLFSHAFYAQPLIGEELIDWAEILHIHGISRSFDLSHLADLAARGKALVVTPHDLWSITGGCHSTSGCEKFREGCLACPMVKGESQRLVAISHKFKQKVLSSSVHALICPSSRIRNELVRCPGFQTIDSYVIPYCLEPEGCGPEQRAAARATLKVPSDRKWILFVANTANESKKAFWDFLQLIRDGEQRLGATGRKDTFGVIIAGEVEDIRDIDIGVPLVKVRDLDDPNAFRNAYCAADLLAYTGLEDTLPAVIVEALSFGIPILGYAAGGVGEVVRSGENGKLAAAGNIQELINSFVDLLMNPFCIEDLAAGARRFVQINLDNQKTVQELRSVYAAAVSKAGIKAIPSSECDERVEYQAFALRAIVDLLECAQKRVTELQEEVRWLREQSLALQNLREILERSLQEIELEHEVRWLRNQSVEFGSVRELLRICIAEIDLMFTFAPVQVRNQYVQIAQEITEKGATDPGRSLDEQWRETSTKIYLLKEVLGWRPEKR